jgi:SNF2 family DNA or RNA helicase
MRKLILHVSLSEDGTFFHLREFEEVAEGKRYINYFDGGHYQRLPDYKRLQDGYSRVAASDVSVEAIDKLKHCSVEFDEDAKIVFDYWMTVLQASRHTAARVADFKGAGVIPSDDNIDYGKLSAYQRVGLMNALALPGYGLFMKQGTGKTAVAIMAIVNNAKLKAKPKYRAIVVCPPNVRVNWQSEFKKFAPNANDIDVHVIRGGQVTRLTQIIGAIRSPKPISVVVCNYETLQNSWDALQMVEFDYAILDEGHNIKSHTTKRNVYAQKLGRNAAKRLILTGTPIANNLNDLYTLFEFMGPGTSGFRSFEGFRRYFSKFRQTQHGDQFESAQNLPILKDKLARYSFIISKEEALPYLPEKTFDIAEVEMTPEQSDAYFKLRDELVMEIESTLETAENEAVAINNILTQLLRLSQITSSFRVIPAINDEMGNAVSPRRVIPFETNIKAEYVASLVPEKGPNDKTIIWSNWVEDIVAIETALKEAGENPVSFYGATSFEQRLEAERKFNEDPTCRWFIGNPQAGGTGLNLLGYPPNSPDTYTTNCNHVVYVSQNWSAILREQSEDRCHRRGTREPVRITEVVVPNTIDTVIAVRVAKKRLDAASTLDIKDILNDIKLSLEQV